MLGDRPDVELPTPEQLPNPIRFILKECVGLAVLAKAAHFYDHECRYHSDERTAIDLIENRSKLVASLFGHVRATRDRRDEHG